MKYCSGELEFNDGSIVEFKEWYSDPEHKRPDEIQLEKCEDE